MSTTTLIGFRKFNSKAGKPCCILSLVSSYSDSEIAFGAVGQKCEDVFIPEALHNLITPQVVGKNVILTFGGSVTHPSILAIDFK